MKERELIMEQSYEYFVAAFKDKLENYVDEKGQKVQQGKIAEAVDCTDVHLSGIKKGSRNASPALQARIAEYFKMSVMDFLEYGKSLLEHKHSFRDEKSPEITVQESPRAGVLTDRRPIDLDLVGRIAGLLDDLRYAYHQADNWRGIVESLGDGVLVIEADTARVIFQNQAHKNMSGHDYVGQICENGEICTPADVGECIGRAAIAAGRTVRRITTVEAAPVVVTASPVRDTSGRIIKVVITVSPRVTT